MSAVSEYAAKQTAFNVRQGAAIDKIVAAFDGLTNDVKTLNDKITALQNSPGQISPEDQTSLNEIEAISGANVNKMEAVATALEALDSQTPPTPPVA